MSEIKQTQVSLLKPGSYVILGGVACVVKDIQTSKTGKHGASKCRIDGVGLIDSQKRIEIHPGQDKINVPIVDKKTAQVLSIKENIATVMDMESYETFDLKIPSELKEKVKDGDQVIYWDILGDKVMKQLK
ncbi:translation initiation factor IF-5A [Candidatus Woesearchaeota archaeon]|nr:translation initiation factor IF-5A [Candidatus Woesearchaeota archaeon]